jgi:hypothetical protein
MSCLEIDVDGNQYPLRRFQGQKPGKVESGNSGRGAHPEPTSDKQLVKDVTDALRNKVIASHRVMY